MSGKCYGCSHFTAYYTKAYCCFLRTDCGHCSVTDSTVKKHYGCEGFKPSYHRHALKRGAVINELAVALTKLNAGKLILDERNGQTDITE